MLFRFFATGCNYCKTSVIKFAMKLIFLVLIVSIIQESSTVPASPYVYSKYEGQDDYTYVGTPETQFARFPQCKTGQNQSPINISPPFERGLGKAKLVFGKGYFEVDPTVIIVNSGHEPYLFPTPDIEPSTINFNGIQYTLNHIDFHTGENDNVGSGHLLNGVQYPLAEHFVHIQQKYGTFRNALNHDMGVLILVVISRVSLAFIVRYFIRTVQYRSLLKAIMTWKKSGENCD